MARSGPSSSRSAGRAAPRRRRPTATSAFGVGRRENHDATAFYERFPLPELSGDATIVAPAEVDQLWAGDARAMDAHGRVADGSVALVVTSPPYFAGKEYEEALGHGHVPASYGDYLDMLQDVFSECVRKLEPGGRIAVNVANLGRKPYRSLSADVIDILQNRLKLLLRGEIIWRKAAGAGGSCAWGTYQQPGNPVLRDTTERIVVASKGRFDRAVPRARRAAGGRPSVATIPADEFVEATLDVWDIPPESATRVGHPAPFPVELPQRLIELFTYQGDLVLDPFMGVGSTAVAAVRTGRHYVGFDTDPAYLDAAQQRVDEERLGQRRNGRVHVQVVPGRAEGRESRVEAIARGRKASDVAAAVLAECGLVDVVPKVRCPGGLEVSYEATDPQGRRWRFDVAGAFTSASTPGLRRTDAAWRALGKAVALRYADPDGPPLVLLTTHLPAGTSPAGRALAAATGADEPVAAVIDMLDDESVAALRAVVAPPPAEP